VEPFRIAFALWNYKAAFAAIPKAFYKTAKLHFHEAHTTLIFLQSVAKSILKHCLFSSRRHSQQDSSAEHLLCGTAL